MKNILITLFCLTVVLAKSQSNIYKPFPEIYGDWITIGSDECPCPHNSISYTKGDTLINGLKYMKVYANSIFQTGQDYQTGHPIYSLNAQKNLILLYRNDLQNKKVYKIDVTGNYFAPEELWYDFDLHLQAGDTLKTSASSVSDNSELLILNSMDSVLVCDDYHKVYHFNVFQYPSGEIIDLIEGFGFSTGLMYFDSQSMAPADKVTYSSKDYCSAEPSQYDAITTGINELANTVYQSTVFPNPSNSLIKITILSGATSGLAYQVYNSVGELVQGGDLELSGNIDISNLSAGIYALITVNQSSLQSINKLIKE